MAVPRPGLLPPAQKTRWRAGCGSAYLVGGGGRAQAVGAHVLWGHNGGTHTRPTGTYSVRQRYTLTEKAGGRPLPSPMRCHLNDLHVRHVHVPCKTHLQVPPHFEASEVVQVLLIAPRDL